MESMTYKHNEFTITLEHDDSHGAPWDEEDGHGDVSDWTSRDKLPGELVLSTDRRSKRFYDFAGACKLAIKDGWGFLPGKLETRQSPIDGTWIATVRSRGTGKSLNFEGIGKDINQAISAVYAAHRATMSKKEYAAGAAMVDYERLRQWCNDQWSYVGIIVTHDDSGETESLWGIESDSPEYHEEVAQELADTILDRIGDEFAAELEESRPDLTMA